MVQEITQVSEVPNGKVVIDFYATWCGPCKRVSPVFEELDAKKLFPSITFLKVDVDEAEILAAEYSVTSLPTFLLLQDKKEVSVVQGANLNDLMKKLEGLEKK